MSSNLVTALNDELIALRKENAELKKQIEEMDLTWLSYNLHEYNAYTDYIEVRFTALLDKNPVKIFLVSPAGEELIIEGKAYNKELITTFKQKLEEL